MRRGFTLAELVVVLVVTGLASLLALPRFSDYLDWIATDAAARDITVALAVARETAVAQGTLVRLEISADSLSVQVDDSLGWLSWRRFPGPASRGVTVEVSNPEVVFSPNGVGWGASNTTVVLRRGSHEERVTTSRIGRVKRW